MIYFHILDIHTYMHKNIHTDSLQTPQQVLGSASVPKTRYAHIHAYIHTYEDTY